MYTNEMPMAQMPTSQKRCKEVLENTIPQMDELDVAQQHGNLLIWSDDTSL